MLFVLSSWSSILLWVDRLSSFVTQQKHTHHNDQTRQTKSIKKNKKVSQEQFEARDRKKKIFEKNQRFRKKNEGINEEELDQQQTDQQHEDENENNDPNLASENQEPQFKQNPSNITESRTLRKSLQTNQQTNQQNSSTPGEIHNSVHKNINNDNNK